MGVEVSKELTKLKKKADAVFSQYVRLRDSENGIAECITCGKQAHWKTLQAGHFVTRSCNYLRFNEQNVNAQCVGCNMFKSGEQYQYSKNLDLKYGSGTAEELFSLRHKTHKLTTSELEQIISDAKQYISEVE